MSLTFKITNRLLIILFIFFSHTSLGITETLFKVKSITSLATEMNRTVNISSTSEAYRKIQIQSEITSKIKKVLKTKGSLIKENEVNYIYATQNFQWFYFIESTASKDSSPPGWK